MTPRYRVGLLIAGLLVSACDTPSAPRDSAADRPTLAGLLGAGIQTGFAFADRPRQFNFPTDHGPHPAFRNEWWYFTGNLFTAEGRRFGYELTLFRFSLAPPRDVPDASVWSTNQVFFGHFALADVANERFHAAERMTRGHAELGRAGGEPFEVVIQDWSIRSLEAVDPTVWRLTAADGDYALSLTVTNRESPWLQGEQGRSQKSADPRNASYYYSMPRWQTVGSIDIGTERFAVTGESWLDREWSTSALGPDQVGWDWFALQLADDSELMYYQLRRADGSVGPFSGGALRDATGAVHTFTASDVSLAVTRYWQNAQGDTYPAGWQLTVTSVDLQLTVTPAMADQELETLVRYWEGAVDVAGTRGEQPVAGYGYVELTGYSSSARTNSGLGRVQR